MKTTQLTYLLGLTLCICLSCSKGDGDEDELPVTLVGATITAVADIDNQFNGSDIQVLFTASTSEVLVSEYRVFVVSTASTSPFTLDLAESLSADRYTQVTKNGEEQRTVRLAANAVDVNGNSIEEGNYRVFVLTVGVDDTPSLLSSGEVIVISLTNVVNTLTSMSLTAGDLSLDGQGNVYATGNGTVAGDLGGRILRISPQGQVETFAEGFSSPRGLVFDADGFLYVLDNQEGVIYKVDQAGEKEVFKDGLHQPGGLSFNSKQELFVLNSDPDQTLVYDIIRIQPDGTSDNFLTGLTFEDLPAPGVGLDFDAMDNLYIANGLVDGKARIVKFTPEGVMSTFSEAPGDIGFMKFVEIKGEENLLITDTFNSQVHIISSTGGAPALLAGTGEVGDLDGAALRSTFRFPFGITYNSETKEVFVTSIEISQPPSASGPVFLRKIRLDKTGG